MLCLADEIGGHQRRVCRPVGDDEDLGRSRLGIRPDPARDRALRGGDEVVARPRHDVDRVEPERGHPEGERANRAGTAHRVDLRHAEELCGGEDHRVDATAELSLRR
ncbi:hypothetical protein RKD05_003361 [Microbacterium sp. SLBN-111]